MNPFEFILLALLFVLSYMYLSKRERNKAQKAGRKATGLQSAEVENFRKEIAALDERIQVLERIITDRRYDLDKEINDLGS